MPKEMGRATKKFPGDEGGTLPRGGDVQTPPQQPLDRVRMDRTELSSAITQEMQALAGTVSSGLLRMMARHVEVTFTSAVEQVQEALGVTLSDETARRLAEQSGAVAEAQTQAAIMRAAALHRTRSAAALLRLPGAGAAPDPRPQRQRRRGGRGPHHSRGSCPLRDALTLCPANRWLWVK